MIFLYIRALNELGPLERWAQVRERVREATGVDPFLVGDAVSLEAAEVFDGLHHYNTAGALDGLPLKGIQRSLRALAVLDTAVAQRGIACPASR